MENTQTTTATVEQLRAQLAAAEAVEAQRKREEAEALKEAERKIRLRGYRRASAATMRQLRPHMVAIQQELSKLGVTARIQEGSVNRTTLFPSLNLISEYAPVFTEKRVGGGRFSAGVLAGYNIQVGRYYGSPSTFPSKKDGTYNYAKIAENISHRIKVRKAQQEREQKRQSAVVDAKGLAELLGGSVSDGRYDSRGRWVATTPTISLTLEQATKLAEMLTK